MKLHNILYCAAICLVLIGIAGIDGWMFNGTSLAIPLLLLIMSVPLWFLAQKEDGKNRRRRRQ